MSKLTKKQEVQLQNKSTAYETAMQDVKQFEEKKSMELVTKIFETDELNPKKNKKIFKYFENSILFHTGKSIGVDKDALNNIFKAKSLRIDEVRYIFDIMNGLRFKDIGISSLDELFEFKEFMGKLENYLYTLQKGIEQTVNKESKEYFEKTYDKFTFKPLVVQGNFKKIEEQNKIK